MCYAQHQTVWTVCTAIYGTLSLIAIGMQPSSCSVFRGTQVKLVLVTKTSSVNRSNPSHTWFPQWTWSRTVAICSVSCPTSRHSLSKTTLYSLLRTLLLVAGAVSLVLTGQDQRTGPCKDSKTHGMPMNRSLISTWHLAQLQGVYHNIQWAPFLSISGFAPIKWPICFSKSTHVAGSLDILIAT